MGDSCMIIAVSQSYYDSIELEPPTAWPLELGPALLYVHWREQYWSDGLAEELRELIDEHGSSRVRVVAHRSGCFIDGRTPGVFQERREADELAFREKFDQSEKEIDVQVWAFCHEPYSPLWKALESVGVAVREGALDDERRQRLGHRLLDAFERVEASGLRDRLTLYRHHILAAYTALRLDFQLAQEADAGPVPSASDLSLRLAESRRVALDQFVQCSAYLRRLLPDPPGAVAAALARVKSLLKGAPTEVEPGSSAALAGFEDWFRKLDASLEALRAEIAK